jgi:hypothetical protein
MQRELNALRKEIAALRADGQRMKKHASAAATAGVSSLGAIKENLVDKVSEIKSTLASGASGAMEEIAEQLEELRETVSDYSEEAKKNFNAHPFVVIAGALAVGLLIGRLTR